MKKTIIIISIAVIILSASGLAYLNNVLLPRKVKGLIVKAIENQTQKKVTLGSLRINIFKGLVFKDLNIYDKDAEIIKVKEAYCVFWVWGLIQKKVVIPSINLDSAQIFLEKRKDNSFNLTDLFSSQQKDNSKKPAVTQPSGVTDKGAKPSAGFKIEIYRINIFNSMINFRDNSLNTVFSQDLNDVNVNIHLSLPASLRFKASAQIPGGEKSKSSIALAGEFRILQEELNANISINSLSPDKFAAYYQSSGIGIKNGLIDATVSLVLKDNAMNLNCQLKSSGLSLTKDKMLFNINSQINAAIRYVLNEKNILYSGKAIFTDSSISGLDLVGAANGLSGVVNFDNNGLSSDNIQANIWNFPVRARLKLSNFSNPILDVDLISNLDLTKAQDLLKNKFNFILPAKLSGNALILLNISTNKLKKGIFDLSGYLDIVNAIIKLDQINDPIQEVSGRLDFTSDQLQAKEVNFKYQGLPYKLSLLINNFKSPVVGLDLTSEDLAVKTNFTVDKAKANISVFSGKYLNSDFNLTGNLDTSSSDADISGVLNIKLRDLKKPLVKFKGLMDRISPEGDLQVKFTLSGAIKDIKNCAIESQISSPQISLYGLKGGGFYCGYSQQSGIMDVPFLNLSFYGGTVNASAKANLKSDDLPYSVNLSMQGVRLEELKSDIGAKDKDISGTMQGEVKADGLYKDLSKLTGTGKLSITKGKLWELNIFKGLGKVLFTKDFAQMVFYEGSCSFIIQDSFILTKDLMLKSNMACLSGLVKLGFNSSIDASLNIDIIDNLIPLDGTFKEITTAVIGNADKFATINITGTLSDPKYKIKPAIDNIIKGFANMINKNIFKK
ncbi:MAG: DUF3971 domain-containing protein [Candidatus Omnitrophota bacterium]|jgi:hypothetical protein